MKPELYSVYESDDGLWVITNNDDIHNIELSPVGSDGSWIACFDYTCNKYDGDNLKLKYDPT